MIKLNIPVLVEGKYDKIKVKSVVEATVLSTDGFGIFNNAEKRALIRRLGKDGVILLSDSDGGGQLIRSHLRGMLSGIPVYDLYVPQIAGKERRKAAPSKAGFLGVEGIPADLLRNVFEKFAAAHPELCGGEASPSPVPPLTAARLYTLGLTGRPDSAALRDAVCGRLGLPSGMSAKAFLEAVNLLSCSEEMLLE
ncbi:MAG: toprim domain-containing protein [Eubacteriales bacterium]